ncbi:redox-regulated ATPase YchF [Patescibacteria group bacterium]|nr:redox-regulated ATPase YchF [Patescibacteria group bacterium]
MKIGIVGLPNVGKSTLFRALTKKQIDISNYPFTTIEPNVGIAEVPDARLEKLGAISHSAKIVPAIIEFVDIAGLVKGAAEGEGLGNKFLSHIKEVDTIAEVVRVFENKNIIHVHNKVDPANDIEIIHLELILKDLETIKKRMQNIEKDVRSQKKEAIAERATLEKIKSFLEQGILPDAKTLSEEENKIIAQLGLLTAKPILFVLNGSEAMLQNKWKPDDALIKAMAGRPYVVLAANLEDEINALDAKEQKEFMQSLGLAQSGLADVIKKGYEILNLITFLTTGETETRAWTIPAGSCAPRAGRAIHSDFEEKFIRAEVISYEKFVEAGSYARARELGWLRTEGKEYVVQDGDVIEFKI